MSVESRCLSYKAAYSKLIYSLHENYQRLEGCVPAIAIHGVNAPFYKPDNLPRYQIKSDVKSSSKDMAYKENCRLNRFLDNIYKTQGVFKGEGCIVLLRWIYKEIAENADPELCYHLANIGKKLTTIVDGGETVVLTPKNAEIFLELALKITTTASDIIQAYLDRQEPAEAGMRFHD